MGAPDLPPEFAEAFHELYPRARRLAYRILGNASEAEDVAAEALTRALVAALTAPDIREKMLVAGHDPVQGPNTPADARAFMERELAKMAEIVRRTGVRLQP